VRLALALVAVAHAGVALAAPPAREKTAGDLALERRFHDDVARASAEAAAAFDRGTVEREAGRYDPALVEYRRAIALAPQVEHPHRRACQMLEQLNRIDEARAECETALRLAPSSPYAQAALAKVLLRDAAQHDRAFELAEQAATSADVHSDTVGAACIVMFVTAGAAEHRFERMTALDACAARALAADPDGATANFVGALAAGAWGHWYVARTRLDKARAAGLDAKAYDELRADLDRAERDSAPPPPSDLGETLLDVAGWIVSIALVVFVALFVVGRALSKRMERAVAADLAAPRVDAVAFGRAYAFVLRACALGVYAAIAVVLASGALAIAGLAHIDDVPFGVLWIVIVVAGGMLADTARGLRRRHSLDSIGHRVELAHQPRLRELVAEVAETVGTAPATVLYLTPAAEIAIVEHRRDKHAERALVVGLGVLDGLTQLQLCSLLAHDYGHFAGDIAIAMRRRLHDTMVGLAKSGAASALNPMWWLIVAYRRAYLAVSLGAARWQEARADRDAIDAYGTASFVGAVRYAATREHAFAAAVGRMIEVAIAARAPLPNVYRDAIATPADAAALARAPLPLDGHASAAARIAFAERLAVDVETEAGDDDPAWALFDRRDELEAHALELLRVRTIDTLGVKAEYLESGASAA
jgi:hypothetical protein